MPILPLFFSRVLVVLATAEVDVFLELSWFFFFFFFFFLTLHNCISFAKYQNESTTGMKKVGLKLNILKMKIMASGPITS